jgi:hypothetical protein
MDETPSIEQNMEAEMDIEPSDTVLDTVQVEEMEQREDEEDEEFQRWEMEQIKKGGAKAFVDSRSIQKKKKVQLPMSIGPRVTVEEVQRKLKSSLMDLENLHNVHKQQLYTIEVFHQHYELFTLCNCCIKFF